MSKQISSGTVYSVPLFASPVSYPPKKVFKTIFCCAQRSEDGSSVSSHLCLEDVISSKSSLNYREASLSTLLANGVSPRSLSIVDTNRLGIDDGIEVLTRHIIENSSDYFESSKS